MKRSEEFVATDPNAVIPPDVTQLYNTWLELKKQASTRHNQLNRAVTLQSQYEKLLDEYEEFLETAQGKLRDESLTALNLPDMRQQLDAHKEFFCDLASHRALLDALAEQLDPATRAHHQTRHARLTNLTAVIQERAAARGQKLEHMVNQWANTERHLMVAGEKLNQLEQQVPQRGTTEDTLDETRRRIWSLHAVKNALAEEKAPIYQSIEEARQLLKNVNCPALESDVADFTERLVQLNNNTAIELKKLETLVDQWETFQGDTAVLQSWINMATDRLHVLTSLSERDLQNIGTIKKKIDHFLELRKEAEDKQNLKTRVTTLGQQLLRQRPGDRDLRETLESLDGRWLTLMCELPNNEEQLHSAQVALLPSRQALAELEIWLETVEAVLREDVKHPLSSVMDVQTLLQKYRGLKVDVGNKQLTVDFVNQSTAAMSQGEGDKPHVTEQAEFAEKLGHINQRYASVASDVTEKLKMLEMADMRWDDYEKAVNSLQNWFIEQSGRIQKHQQLGHEVTLTHALKECKVLEEELKVKETEIDQLRARGLALSEVDPSLANRESPVTTTIHQLNTDWAQLNHEVYRVQDILEDALRQWDTYHHLVSKVNTELANTEYALNRFNLATGNIELFAGQLTEVKMVQNEFVQSQDDIRLLIETANQLTEGSDNPVSQHVRKTVKDIQERRAKLKDALADKLRVFSEVLSAWDRYNVDQSKAKSWLEEHEREVQRLALSQDNLDELKERQPRIKELLEELTVFEERLADLGGQNEKLTPHMDHTAIISTSSHHMRLKTRTKQLKATLNKLLQTLSSDKLKHSNFSEVREQLEHFLQHMDEILRDEDPYRSADEDALKARLGELKNVAHEFSQRLPVLNRLNHMAYRLPLGGQDAELMRNLNHRWEVLHADTNERYCALQEHLLEHQDFDDKLRDWESFAARIEKQVTSEPAKNFETLIEQQKACEMLQTEIYSGQHVLRLIVSQANEKTESDDTTESSDLESKVKSLQEQWARIVKLSNELKCGVDFAIDQWRNYNYHHERLTFKLADMEECLLSFEFEAAPIQHIRGLLDNIKMCEKELETQDPVFSKVQECSEALVSISDEPTSRHLKQTIETLRQRWLHIAAQLASHNENVSTILQKWSEAEDGIEDLLLWLRDMRRALTSEIPTSYDDLQRSLSQCKEFDVSFERWQPKQEALGECERELAVCVNEEDLSILQQRLSLLTKQWHEIRHQVVLRRQNIEARLARWSNFVTRYKELMDWIAAMENKVSSNADYHIEDIISMLQNEYRDEISAMAIERDALIQRGTELIDASSEVRGSDIELKIMRLQEKWQKLEDLAAQRLKKLQDTLLVIQQLEANMSNLRIWLAHVEHDLNSPISYQYNTAAEIHKKLQEQQDLHNDIEKHSSGVASVLNLCEVLLRDGDACPTDVECSAIEQAMQSLDKRWRNICTLIMERKVRIEETWHLWQQFEDDQTRFDDWIKDIERHTRLPRSENVTIVVAKEELKKYESMQRRIHENLMSLEQLNRSYRRLARDGCIDTAGQLRSQIYNVNTRWDDLNSRTHAVVRRLRHMISISDDFEATREGLMVWLKDLSVRLSIIEQKAQEGQPPDDAILALRNEINKNGHRLEYIDKAGMYLLMRSEPTDAVLIQHELDLFHQLLQSILDRIVALQNHQLAASPVRTTTTSSSPFKKVVRYRPQRPVGMGAPERGAVDEEAHRHRRRSGSPPSDDDEAELFENVELTDLVKHLPSDLSDDDDELDSSIGRLGLSSHERWEIVLEEVANHPEIALDIQRSIDDLERAMRRADSSLTTAENQLKLALLAGTATLESHGHYIHLLMPCEENLNQVRGIAAQIRQDLGLASLGPVELEIQDLVDRWERLQTKAIEKDYQRGQEAQQLAQLKTDLLNLLLWLDDAEVKLDSNRVVPTDMQQLDHAIRTHEEFLTQLSARRPIVLSLNLLSKQYLRNDTAETMSLRTQLVMMNRRFDAVNDRAKDWDAKLQQAWIQGRDLFRVIQDMFVWLDEAEVSVRSCEPHDLHAEQAILHDKYQRLKDLRADLERAQARVASVRDMAERFLPGIDSEKATCAREDLLILSERIKALLKLCLTYMTRIDTRLNVAISEPAASAHLRSTLQSRRMLAMAAGPASRGALGASHTDFDNFGTGRESSRGSWHRRMFLARVFRTALPIQMLMLLLLGMACLVPMSEEDFSCLLTNNFRSSFDPMLRYTDGPPPF